MEWWVWAGGAVAVGGAVIFAKQTAPRSSAAASTDLGVKLGTASTSEHARAQQLIPAAQIALRRLQELLQAKHGIRTYVGSTKRTDAQQAANVAKGVSATEKSWHKLGRGVDLYVYDPATGKTDLNGKRVDLFRTMHQESAQFGWRGLAFHPDGTKRYITTKKGKIWDGGHLEFPEGMTFAQASHAKGGAA